MLGLVIGLYYAWEVEPVVVVDNTPGDLERHHYSEYVLLIAQTFSIEQDVNLARARLSTLSTNNPASIPSEQAENMILTGANPSDIQAMVDLAAALGVTDPSLDSYLP
jgi:hypothetical protein